MDPEPDPHQHEKWDPDPDVDLFSLLMITELGFLKLIRVFKNLDSGCEARSGLPVKTNYVPIEVNIFKAKS